MTLHSVTQSPRHDGTTRKSPLAVVMIWDKAPTQLKEPARAGVAALIRQRLRAIKGRSIMMKVLTRRKSLNEEVIERASEKSPPTGAARLRCWLCMADWEQRRRLNDGYRAAGLSRSC